MQFTSLKAFLKPGTMFRSSEREWVVEQVEYFDCEPSKPKLWTGRTRHFGERTSKPTSFDVQGLSDDAYNGLTIIRLGGTPIQLEDLI